LGSTEDGGQDNRHPVIARMHSIRGNLAFRVLRIQFLDEYYYVAIYSANLWRSPKDFIEIAASTFGLLAMTNNKGRRNASPLQISIA
jgi:hypothetical protein